MKKIAGLLIGAVAFIGFSSSAVPSSCEPCPPVEVKCSVPKYKWVTRYKKVCRTKWVTKYKWVTNTRNETSYRTPL